MELDSLGNKKFWFLLEDGQLLIYSPEYIEQLTWEGNNECKIHILKKIWLLLSIPSKQKISVFWVYRRCEDKEAFNQAADLKYLNPDISLEMMEVCKNSYIEKFFSNDFKINNELKLNELRLNEKKQEFPILKHLDEHYSFYLLLKEYRKTIKQYLSDV
ncbi:hypothetical protein BWD10_02440 [Neisseria zoodegmatis]|uniref:Uncharacterized protein n=1 Tax=Neisseria zoodegmatis TaxID=326523 RepID=A0ABX3WGK9_9NEIS|nr:hypothetical protein BWD10_02440 [Neisseria zoodegmatis]